MKHTWLIWGLLLSVVLGCALPGRNPDGSFDVEIKIPESVIQEQVTTALGDSEFQDVTVDLKDGYILVTARRGRDGAALFDTLTFRVDLSVQDGQLQATISQAQIEGVPFLDSMLPSWNTLIAQELTLSGSNTSGGTLHAVRITEEHVILVWRVGGQPRN